MIFFRPESFKGYIKNYPVTVGIVAICLFIYIVAQIIGYEFYLQLMFVTVPGTESWGLSEPWRYVTSLFLHTNFATLFSSLIMLLIFAPPMEKIIGSKRYLALCVLSGIGANILGAIISNIDKQTHFSLGAHGILFGIFGGYLFIALFRKMFLDSASVKTIYIIIGLNILTLFIFERFDIWGHIGGFITGFMMYRFFDYMQIMKLQKRDNVK